MKKVLTLFYLFISLFATDAFSTVQDNQWTLESPPALALRTWVRIDKFGISIKGENLTDKTHYLSVEVRGTYGSGKEYKEQHTLRVDSKDTNKTRILSQSDNYSQLKSWNYNWKWKSGVKKKKRKPRYSSDGWYGYQNSPNKDRERELRRYVKSFKRITVNGNFDALCRSIGKRCKSVIDWEGHSFSCQGHSYDGSRLAKCVGGVKSASASLLMLIDVSGSMSGAKLSSAKRAAIESIRKVIKQGTEVSVMAFSGSCSTPISKKISFTRDENALVSFIRSLQASGGTPLGNALREANKSMKRDKFFGSKTQMILLLADGDDNCKNSDQVMAALRRQGIIFRHETVGLDIGADSSAASQLQRIAGKTGGKFHHTQDHRKLASIFLEAIDTMSILDMLGGFNKTNKKRKKT
ncbi:MAG: hypothetical protein ACI86H_001567 [bacterium]|jgi:uncharacterized protein YegL